MNYETVIGLEVHAQLLTESKMFCRCSAAYADATPNTHVCPVCLGMPGVLPTINRKAVELTMMTALALNCPISEYSKFDRKNYSYPDLMKGYQISQYDMPIGLKGFLNVTTDGQTRKLGITRVHLEEDVARLVHKASFDGNYSLMDVNRAGAPLMEIVGEPDIRSPEEARQYLMKLQNILRYLGVSTGNMEEGSFRCDANISIKPEGADKTLNKVEVKNMNSFRAVFRALEYEAIRQREWANDGKHIVQETRGWIEETGKTVSQRSKEFAHDYRYFPEPDLPPLLISRAWVDEVQSKLPELPDAKHDRFISEYGLTDYDAALLTSARELAAYFEDCVKTPADGKISSGKGAKEVSNWLIGEVTRIMNANNLDITALRQKIAPEQLCELVAAANSAINGATAKTVLDKMFATGKPAGQIISEDGLAQISDQDEVKNLVRGVLQANAAAVADYKAGKKAAQGFLTGQVMRATKGRANPKIVNEILSKLLEEV